MLLEMTSQIPTLSNLNCTARVGARIQVALGMTRHVLVENTCVEEVRIANGAVCLSVLAFDDSPRPLVALASFHQTIVSELVTGFFAESAGEESWVDVTTTYDREFVIALDLVLVQEKAGKQLDRVLARENVLHVVPHICKTTCLVPRILLS